MKALVQKYAKSQSAFFRDFDAFYHKMGLKGWAA